MPRKPDPEAEELKLIARLRADNWQVYRDDSPCDADLRGYYVPISMLNFRRGNLSLERWRNGQVRCREQREDGSDVRYYPDFETALKACNRKARK